jgi:LruC domain-containing protein
MHHLSDYFVILAAKTYIIMRKSLIITLIAGVATTLTMVSCNKNVYDEERHGELIHYYSSVDSVDQQHMWMLTQSKTLRYQVPSGSSYEQLRFYTADPLTDKSAELMNTVFVQSGQSGSVSLSVPYLQSSIYAALMDGDGNYSVTSVSTSQTSVDFTETTTGKPLSSLKPQTYSFLFEENYPEPGDYDYNDVVLRVSQQRTAKNQITIGVTISAVGADKQIAGCIRLVGYRYQDIDSVYTTNGKSFNDGINTQMLYFHKETDYLIKGRNNEAVLNLFCDAHWAMAFNLSADYGLFQRKKYNVSTSTSDNYQLRSTRTIKYVINFKSADALNYFTLDTLDPFIITDYNAGTWETHTEQFKSAQVLHEYFVPSFKDLPWALMVPQSDFAYPLEGNEIGFRKRLESGAVAMFGAYTTVGHSFGEWAEDHTRFLDWYLYPNQQVTF